MEHALEVDAEAPEGVAVEAGHTIYVVVDLHTIRPLLPLPLPARPLAVERRVALLEAEGPCEEVMRRTCMDHSRRPQEQPHCLELVEAGAVVPWVRPWTAWHSGVAVEAAEGQPYGHCRKALEVEHR